MRPTAAPFMPGGPLGQPTAHPIAGITASWRQSLERDRGRGRGRGQAGGRGQALGPSPLAHVQFAPQPSADEELAIAVENLGITSREEQQTAADVDDEEEEGWPKGQQFSF